VGTGIGRKKKVDRQEKGRRGEEEKRRRGEEEKKDRRGTRDECGVQCPTALATCARCEVVSQKHTNRRGKDIKKKG